MIKMNFLKNSLKCGVLFSNILNCCATEKNYIDINTVINAMENNHIDINTAINDEFNKIIKSENNSKNLINIGMLNKMCKININNKTYLVTYNKNDKQIKRRYIPNYIAKNEILRYFLNSPQPEIINISTQEFIEGFCFPFNVELNYLLNYKICDENGIEQGCKYLKDRINPKSDIEIDCKLTKQDFENSLKFLNNLTEDQKKDILIKNLFRNFFFVLPDDCARNSIIVFKEKYYDISYIDLDLPLFTGEFFLKTDILDFFIKNYDIDNDKINNYITDILKDKDPEILSKKIEQNILKVHNNYEDKFSMSDSFVQCNLKLCQEQRVNYKIYNIKDITKLTIKDSIDYCVNSFEAIFNCKYLKFKNLNGDFLSKKTIDLLENKIKQFKEFLKDYEEKYKDIFKVSISK